MARATSQYICQECGGIQNKWAGQCIACNGWNTLVEEKIEEMPKGLKIGKGQKIELFGLQGTSDILSRDNTGISEFDRVCGGGIVPGSAILVGGDPGIGKSTVLLQAVAALSHSLECYYISGEESIDQVRLRAQRLQVDNAPVKLASATNLRDILSSIECPNPPRLLIIDSIQTMYIDNIESAPGTVSQVRACAAELIRATKKRGVTLIMVGHVTKEGTIAGPRVLEHMVDTVLYFEGDRGHQFRILRAVKNRFGPTDEIGVFEMTELGLREVSNPSALFLANRSGDVSGSAVFAGIEGSRPVLVEVQALVAQSSYAAPKRTVVGWDSGRLSMILAVLEARCGVSLCNKDVYLNFAGGLRVQEPAADMAVAAALLSAVSQIAMPMEAVVFGEIGLSGEIRAVGQMELRLKEAAKLGFTKVFMPKPRNDMLTKQMDVEKHFMDKLSELVEYFDTPDQTKLKAVN